MRFYESLRHAVSLVAGGAIVAACGVAYAGESIAVTNARIYTVTGAVIDPGVLVCENGKISALGPVGRVRIPPGARLIDGSGKAVMPGLIETHSHMGMKRLWVPADLDNNETSGPINARLRALESIDTRDRAFRLALAAGVTTMVVSPGAQTPIGGQAVVLKLRGGTADDMYLAPGGMKFAMSSTFFPDGGGGAHPSSLMGVASILRENLLAARAYRERWEAHVAAGRQEPAPSRDPQLEALGKVLTREWVVGVHAQWPAQIVNVLRLAREFDLDLYIVHGTTLVDLVDEVARAGVAVSFGPVLPFQSREARMLDGPAQLVRRGGRVAFQQDHPDGPQLYLRHVAALCVRHGLPEAEALKALTINGAALFRLEKRLGSLEAGKDADFLILSGAPLEIDSHVEQVFVEGHEVYNRAANRSVFDVRR